MNTIKTIRIFVAALSTLSALTVLPFDASAQKPAVKNVERTASKAGEVVGKNGKKIIKGTAKDTHKAAKSVGDAATKTGEVVGKDGRKVVKGTAKDAKKLEKGLGKTLGIKGQARKK